MEGGNERGLCPLDYVPLSGERYQQDLINRDLLSTSLIVGTLGPGMWRDKFNSTSNVLVGVWDTNASEYVWVRRVSR